MCMKKKTKLLIALLLVFVGVGLTYAVYTTSVGGNASVESANWLIKVKVNETETDVSNGSNNVELGSCEKLAPGGSCTLPFRVDATGTEVDTILTVELGNNVTGATLEELTNAGINLRISDGVNEDYAYLLNMGTYKDLNLVINWEAGDEDDDTKAGYDVSIANKLSSITIPVNMVVKQRLGGTRTVTFNTHDSNIQTPESIQVSDGDSILEANIPVLVKNGYIFDGWYTSEVGGIKLTSSTIIIDNIEYHARFREPQNLTVSFNTHGGNNVNSVNVLEGGTLSELPSAPTKLGYTFDGWYTAETDGEAVTTSTVINNTIEFHAQWTIKYVSVTFNSNGGSSVTSPVQVQEGGTVSSIPTSTKSGTDLIGWFDSNGNQLTLSTQIMNDITYTAHWYSAYENAGEIVYYDPVSSATCNANTFDFDAVKNNTSTCYRWRVIKEEENTLNIQLDHNLLNNVGWKNISSDIATVMQDMATETSSWTRVSALNYTYDSTAASTNYGVLSCTNGTCTVSGTTIYNVKARLITGEEVAGITTTQTNGNTTADNWALDNQDAFYFSHTGYIIGTQSHGSGNKNLSWLLENTTSDSSTGATNNSYSNGNSLAYLTLSPRPARSNFYLVHNDGFLGFYSNSDTNIGARPVIKISKSNYNVTFKYNDNATSDLVKSYNCLAKLGTLPVPNQREDYTFLGWNTKSNGTGIYVDENTKVNFNYLYAIWHDNRVSDFTYSSTNQSPQKFTAPYTGTYKLEVWGAQGGNATDTYQGGKGGYATGTITLTQGDEIYVVVGGQGNECTSSCSGGYNGGGSGYTSTGTVGSGGGATHIGTFNSTLSSHNSNAGLYIVAGAGGGAMNNSDCSSYGNGGFGGGLTGGVVSATSGRTHKNDGTGGSQDSGGTYGAYYNSNTAGVNTSSSNGKFGQGGSNSGTSAGTYVAGGGSGYYGGGAGYLTGGTGGSSYIGGVTNGSTIDGNSEMPSPTGGTEIGHSGNGYARITYIGN